MSASVQPPVHPRREGISGAKALLAVFVSTALGMVTSTFLPANTRYQHEWDGTVLTSAVGEEEKSADWPQWCGSPGRNNVAREDNPPTDWNVGKFERKTDKWLSDDARNVKWVSRIGSQTYMTPSIVGDRIFVGTNNGGEYLERYPKKVDLGCILCFNRADGKFLWQYSSEKLPDGGLDWELQGICSSPLVEGSRLWCVSNRGEVVCLDTEGFSDNENDGPFKEEKKTSLQEADVIWKYDFMKENGVLQHNMCSCSVTALGDVLFVSTSNGVSEKDHDIIPAPKAPSFMALDKATGKVLWTDASPGMNILHGQWSSPAAGLLGGVPQVIFAGGDGWLYSFRADAGKDGRPELLWRFDCNPKKSKWLGTGRGERNSIIATPVIAGGYVYIATGQDPENNEGPGRLWCIDPTRRGDVSSEIVELNVNAVGPEPDRRTCAVDERRGEKVSKNPNSASVWVYTSSDLNKDGKIQFEEELHRTLSSVAVKNGILVLTDLSGIVHCLDARTGAVHWTYDLMGPIWSGPMIAGDKIFISEEEGDISIFNLSPQAHDPVKEINMEDSLYGAPVFVDGVLYVASKSRLYAIEKGKEDEKAK